jgi:ketosteroid isomerase-like protein
MNANPSPTPDSSDCSQAAAALAHFFETLSPDSLNDLHRHYAPDARFKDPFNEVTGIPAIHAIFEHMFRQLEKPRFVVTRQVVQGNQCFMTWDFQFGFKDTQRGTMQTIRGATHLEFSAGGQATLHRDYWDAAEELYEKLPGIGALMRWLKRRAQG